MEMDGTVEGCVVLIKCFGSHGMHVCSCCFTMVDVMCRQDAKTPRDAEISSPLLYIHVPERESLELGRGGLI